MVFDEAHNLSSALSEIHSPRVTRDMLALSLRQLEAYHARYADRLSSLSHSFLIHLQTVLRALLAVLTSPPPALGRVSVLRTDAFCDCSAWRTSTCSTCCGSSPPSASCSN